jgi:hypothetical protein
MSSEKTSSYELPYFEPSGPSVSKDYKKWKADTMDILSTRLFPTYSQGLLGFILSTEQYAVIEPDEPFQAVSAPALAADATDANTKAYNALKLKHDIQRLEVRNAAMKMYKALGPAAQQLLLDERGNVIRDPKEMVKRLDAEYLLVTQQDIDTMIATLCSPYNRAVDFKTLVMSHKEIHLALTRANQPMPEYLKIRYMAEAVRNVPALHATVDRYFDEVPSLSDQTYTGMSAKLMNFVANRGDSMTTSSFAGAATSSIQAQLDEARREIVQMRRRLEEVSVKPAAATGPRPTRAKQYCWSHGMKYHSSAECFEHARKPGHQTTATEHNKMGGKGSDGN